MFDTKILPYFKDKSISDITAADIRAWQNTLIKENFAPLVLLWMNASSGNGTSTVESHYAIPPTTNEMLKICRSIA